MTYPDISSWLDERRAIAERLGYDTLFVVATIVLLGLIIRLIDLPQQSSRPSIILYAPSVFLGFSGRSVAA